MAWQPSPPTQWSLAPLPHPKTNLLLIRNSTSKSTHHTRAERTNWLAWRMETLTTSSSTGATKIACISARAPLFRLSTALQSEIIRNWVEGVFVRTASAKRGPLLELQITAVRKAPVPKVDTFSVALQSTLNLSYCHIFMPLDDALSCFFQWLDLPTGICALS